MPLQHAVNGAVTLVPNPHYVDLYCRSTQAVDFHSFISNVYGVAGHCVTAEAAAVTAYLCWGTLQD